MRSACRNESFERLSEKSRNAKARSLRRAFYDLLTIYSKSNEQPTRLIIPQEPTYADDLLCRLVPVGRAGVRQYAAQCRHHQSKTGLLGATSAPRSPVTNMPSARNEGRETQIELMGYFSEIVDPPQREQTGRPPSRPWQAHDEGFSKSGATHPSPAPIGVMSRRGVCSITFMRTSSSIWGFIFARPTRPNITTQNISCASSISTRW